MAKALKPTGSKKVKKTAVSTKNRFLFKEMKLVDIDTLKPHPLNPNEGDIPSIQESLDETGMYKPIVWNARNSFIAAGHHTWLAARAEGWTQIGIVVIDVDEDTHMRIMLADNKTADRRRYNEALLAQILSGMENVRGTGYDSDEVQEIVERNRGQLEDAVSEIKRRQEEDERSLREAQEAKTFNRIPLGEEEGATDYDTDITDDEDAEIGGVGSGTELEKAKEELTGAFSLKPDMAFDGVGLWGIPRIRTDQLMTYDDLPEKLEAWAGSATKDWPDPDQWWLYNFGIDSTSGMRDVSKMILAFYAHDEYFENWWHYPDKYVTKVLNSGIKYIVMPDFSFHTPGEESRAISMWSLYRNRWLARYFQEAGLKLIPDVTWATGDEAFLTKYVLPTLPKNIPLLALQVQTADEKSKLHSDYVRQVQLIIDTLKPKDLLVYYGKQGKRMFDSGQIKFNGRIKFVASRLHRLSEQAKKRQKKTTL